MKKDKKLYENLTKEYFDTVEEKGLSKNLCNYFWNVLVATQRGYSFCGAHTLFYSIIGLQNMNLAYRFPIIFWNTANLIVDSSGVDDNEEIEEEVEQDELVSIFEEEDTENYDYIDSPDRKTKVKRAKKATNYGKIATAIGKFKAIGINILPPDINTSSYTFTPNVENNSISYGLKGITRISDDLIKEIIDNRPYSSFDDFTSKIKANRLQLINLIKSGAFDNLYDEGREKLFYHFIDTLVDKKIKLTLANMPMLINYNLIPDEMSFYPTLFSLNKFLKTKKNGDYYLLTDKAINFIGEHFDIDIISNSNSILQKTWDNIYKKAMEPMRVFLKENMNDLLDKINCKLFEEEKEKYATGTISSWEMDSIGFYYHEHELESIKDNYDDFFLLPEEPEIDRVFPAKNGGEIKMYKLSRIVGTVIDKNKLKNMITLLTPTGVVNVKIYKSQYSSFDKQISVRGEDGKKKVIEKSWLSRGNLLLIQGIRKGDDFILKSYKNSAYPVISKIISINDNGSLELQYERSVPEEV